MLKKSVFVSAWFLLLPCDSYSERFEFDYEFGSYDEYNNYENYGPKIPAVVFEGEPIYHGRIARPIDWPFHDDEAQDRYAHAVRSQYQEFQMAEVNELLKYRRIEDAHAHKEMEYTNSIKAKMNVKAFSRYKFNDYHYSFDQLVMRTPYHNQFEYNGISQDDQTMPSYYQNQGNEFIERNCYDMSSKVGGEILLIPRLSDGCVKVNNLVNLNRLDIAVIGKNDVKQLQMYYETEINGTVVLRNHSAINNLYLYLVGNDVLILNINVENGQTVDELFELTYEDKYGPENFTVTSVKDTELAQLNDMHLISFNKHYRLNHMQLNLADAVKIREKKQEYTMEEIDLLFFNEFRGRFDDEVN